MVPDIHAVIERDDVPVQVNGRAVSEAHRHGAELRAGLSQDLVLHRIPAVIVREYAVPVLAGELRLKHSGEHDCGVVHGQDAEGAVEADDRLPRVVEQGVGELPLAEEPLCGTGRVLEILLLQLPLALSHLPALAAPGRDEGRKEDDERAGCGEAPERSLARAEDSHVYEIMAAC